MDKNDFWSYNSGCLAHLLNREVVPLSPKGKVIVAHPHLVTASICGEQLSEYEVEYVSSLEQLFHTATSSHDGIVVACCFPGREPDGLAFAAQYSRGKLRGFHGKVVGLSCCDRHTEFFSRLKVDARDNTGLACQRLAELLEDPVSS